MESHFDEVINRLETNSIKWDTLEDRYGSTEVLPMWIADMDFKTPKVVLDALKNTLENCPVLGYTKAPDSLYEAIIDWQQQKHNMSLTREAILFSPGVVPSLALVVNAFTSPEDNVMIHDPVYPPFTSMITANQRKVLRSELTIKDNQFVMNFEEIEQQFKTKDVKLSILCNPHNPGGRVWSKDELIQLSELCYKYKVILVSDEIHGDLIFNPHRFTSVVTIDERYQDFVVTLTAATKTFNMAGTKNSMIYVYNEGLRNLLVQEQHKSEQSGINTFGYVATEAAYRLGDDWLADCLDYLEGNLALVVDFFATELPEVMVVKPQGTYLVWFNASSLGLEDQALTQHFVEVGKIGLNAGIDFGPAGSQFLRMNIATSRTTLVEGLKRIKYAFTH